MSSYAKGITRRRKITLSRQALARARSVLRRRNAAPTRSGGFYGLYTKRGRDELKTVDTSASNLAVSTTPQFVLLNGVATGTDYNTRVGRKTLLKSLYVRINFKFNSNNPVAGVACRLMIIQDKQSNGAVPTIANVLQTGNYIDPINLDNRERFNVLMDKLYTFFPASTSAGPIIGGGNPITKTVKVYKKLNLATIFSGVGATIGSIQTGGIWMLWVTDTGVAATPHYLLDYYSRVRFVDS